MEAIRARLHGAFTPLYFSGIHGFPHEFHKIVLRTVPEFLGSDEDKEIHNMVSFCKLMVDLKVYHDDDLMIVFALTFERDAEDWFNDLWDESIDSIELFFEKFLLRWHEGTIDEIEQLAKEFDTLLPRTQPNSREEIYEEQIIEDLVDEAVHKPFFEDIS